MRVCSTIDADAVNQPEHNTAAAGFFRVGGFLARRIYFLRDQIFCRRRQKFGGPLGVSQHAKPTQ